MRDVAI